jgi:uncharacterized YigZ family protein
MVSKILNYHYLYFSVKQKRIKKISTYRTIAKLSEGVYKEKGSKFIGYATACYSEDEAKTFIEKWKKENHQARHLCYAYRFGVDMKTYRANDDGEPNNSAGQPILGQIQSFELTNILIGVVRYYGGTKLGVGGLINAYRTAAKEAIEHGEIVVKEVFFWADLNFSYEDMPSIMNFIKQNNITIEKQLFELNCNLKVRLDLNASEHLTAELKKYASIEITELGIY